MIRISQRDIRWTNLKLLPSKLTMGRYGCTTSCVCMISDYFECYSDPRAAIDQYIKYNEDGLILWDKINFLNFRFEKRLAGWQLAEIAESLKNPDKAVILQVANSSHWVVAVRRIPGTKHYFIVDPFDGKLKTSYKYENVTGSAHFVKK